VLQFGVAVWCNVLQCFVLRQIASVLEIEPPPFAVCVVSVFYCSVLYCVGLQVCLRSSHCSVAMWCCSVVLQCVAAVCCGVLQCVAVRRIADVLEVEPQCGVAVCCCSLMLQCTGVHWSKFECKCA